MKRVSDDDIYAGSGSQFKRPYSSSRGDSYGQTQVPGGGGGGGGSVGGGAITSQKLGHNEAISFVNKIKKRFQSDEHVYKSFLDIINMYRKKHKDMGEVYSEVTTLFKDHRDLLLGHNTFLPKGYEITLDEDEAPPKKTVEFEEAMSFLNKIKKRFQSDEHVYISFLDMMIMYRREHKDMGEAYSEVATLFKDHRDLLEEFTRFLPDSSAAPSTQHAPDARNSLQRFSERSSMAPMMRQMQVDKTQGYRRKRLPSHDRERDLSVENPEMDDEKRMMNMHKKRRKRESKDKRINRDQDEREPDHTNAQQFLEKNKSVKKAEGFGLASDFSSKEDKDTLKNMYSQAISFSEKVKEKLNSADDYQAFLKCLHIFFTGGIINRNELQNLVTDLLGKHPDLMKEFNDFLERCENIDRFLAGVMSKKSLRSSKLEDKDKDKDKDKEQKREMDGAKEKERYREKKYMGKSIQELDLSDCKRCTPSYRLLPADYPIPTASQRSELGAQVLNDHWVSVSSGSEDYSFEHMCRNQYEESLFRCEDDRFELDMLLESVSSAAKRAEELYNNMNENKINMETLNRIEDYFTVQNLRCIERLYGNHGLDVIDILRKNPTRALPVILTRLKQKQEEWSRCRSDFNKVWAEIYSKIHLK
ncbi:paired amphipathic helix protein Sin3-like 2 [Gastrolobium bilobum]|uniref:paired amphipathic helix protein Sin3-like 2 n=1 Tax=Gastrolobium bilobum TaxID=150636 RepID=UPI002AB0391A|nr:paired amphipathic helix protein Sin3-like 2 [Gastrolobium bilobum]